MRSIEAMNILETISQELNQISQKTDLAVELVSNLPFAEDEDCFRQEYREPLQTSFYWIPWTEQIGAWIDSNGSQVSVVIRQDAINSEIKTLMLGLSSVITGVYFNLQSKMAIHANAISLGDSVCAFAGYSGMGKSTLTAYCASKGAGFITDDVLIVNQEGLVTPGSPNLKLYSHTGKSLGLDVVETADYKIFYDVEQLGAKINCSPLPLSIIYLLAQSEDLSIYSEQLLPSQAVFELLTHSYYASELIADNPSILETYINLATSIPVRKLFYPRNFQLLPQVYDFLTKEVCQLQTT